MTGKAAGRVLAGVSPTFLTWGSVDPHRRQPLPEHLNKEPNR